MSYVEWLYAVAPFAIPVGAAGGWLVVWLRPPHARHCCPATAGSFVDPQPTVCTCTCKRCRDGQHELAGQH